VVVLPCGAGKTVVGMAIAAALQTECLILCTNITAVRQWIAELLDKTSLGEDQIGEYSGQKKQIRPVTVTTYQIMSRRKGESYPHLDLFSLRNWGLILYDEVHLLPAPVFRVTAELQARRRLGLTATLIREDGLETDVFSLIGPKRYDVPWREMEEGGYIARAQCREVRVEMPARLRMACAAEADARRQYRLAAENPAKDEVVADLVNSHPDEGTLIIGQYVDQLKRLASRLNTALITGQTPERKREQLYGQFRAGEIKRLVVSKVANFSIDLPDASVCIQVSGTFGSRQEEAQRLGRILRPKDRPARFYSLVSADSPELRFAMNRQLFLTEQGYEYSIEDRTGGSEPVDTQIIRFPCRSGVGP
jgi:DNA excision repair protein ERCC-3